MLATLNNFIKYSFTIRTLIQVLYDFRIRKALNLLRIKNLNSIILKTKAVIIIVYFVVIKSVIVENDLSTNRSRISSFKIVIFD